MAFASATPCGDAHCFDVHLMWVDARREIGHGGDGGLRVSEDLAEPHRAPVERRVHPAAHAVICDALPCVVGVL